MGPFESEQADALRRDLGKISENFAVEISLALVLPNKVDTRTSLAEDYLDDFRDEYPDAIAPEYIPQSQDIRNAAENGQTAFALEEPSTTADRARSAYLSASGALLTRLGE
jgi:chromosome partitioning protein